MADLVLGTDVGGTFTDVVLHDPARPRPATWKVPTTPDDPSVGALEGMDALLDRAGEAWSDVARVVHGTTAATNALLEREGGRVALVTNEGFEDVVEIGRQDRPALYDLEADPPDPLVGRGDRHGVPGRVRAGGSVEEPLDRAAVREVAGRLDEGVDAVVVGFLHSWANPDHERAARDVVQDERPGVRAFASVEASGSFREYERLATAVAHAYLAPVLDAYLERLEAGLAERNPGTDLHVLDSAGGLLTPRAARAWPARAALSGPASGLVGAQALTGWEETPQLLALDMGGTSTDAGLLVDGEPREADEVTVAGRPLRVAALDVETVGAGGGSIARVEEGGLLRVGPASAGARPGPASYDRGGTEPTVTDAHAVLGRLTPDGFLGGRMTLDVDAARQAVRGAVADPLDLAVEEAAWGVLEVAQARTRGALRVVSTARGHDPRRLALLAYGGAGPLHAAPLARELGIPTVLVPPDPGVFSAAGALHGRARHDRTRGLLEEVADLAPADLQAAVRGAEDDVRDALAADGRDPDEARYRVRADLRYRGQSHEVTVPAAPDDDPADLADAFHREHERLYGLADAGRPVEVVDVQVTAVLRPGPAPDPPAAEAGDAPQRPPRRVRFRDGWHEARVEARRGLGPGEKLRGPAVVEGRSSTTLVPPGTRLRVTPRGVLRLEVHP